MGEGNWGVGGEETNLLEGRMTSLNIEMKN